MLLLSSSLSLSLWLSLLFFGLCLTRYLLKCYQRATKKYFNCLCTSVSSSTVVAVCGHCQQIMQPEINDNNNSKGGAQRGGRSNNICDNKNVQQMARENVFLWPENERLRHWLTATRRLNEWLTDWLPVWVYDYVSVWLRLPWVYKVFISIGSQGYTQRTRRVNKIFRLK